MSRRRKPNGVRSRSRNKPNFGYSGGGGCGASSAIAAPDPREKKKRNAVTWIARDGESSLLNIPRQDTLSSEEGRWFRPSEEQKTRRTEPRPPVLEIALPYGIVD